MLQEPLLLCLGFLHFAPSQRPAWGLLQPGVAELTNQRLPGPRGLTLHPRLAGSDTLATSFAPRVLSFRLLVAGGRGGGLLLISVEPAAARESTTKLSTSLPLLESPGGILNCRIDPKLHPIHMALPTSLNSAAGPCLPYFPTRQHPSPSLPPPPCSHLGTEALALPVPGTPSKIFKRHLPGSHLKVTPPLSPQHTSVLFFNQRWKSISYA